MTGTDAVAPVAMIAVADPVTESSSRCSVGWRTTSRAPEVFSTVTVVVSRPGGPLSTMASSDSDGRARLLVGVLRRGVGIGGLRAR